MRVDSAWRRARAGCAPLRPLRRRLATASGTASRVVPRSQSFSQWYQSAVAAAELTDASAVRGCAILRPQGYALWEAIQRELDGRIKATGAQNVYFPLLIPTSFFSKEAAHVDGFAKECAVVTHHRLRAKEGGGVEVDPTAALSEPYVIRPTSETVIWDAFSRWIQSHRDLPLLINQWANVVRWEMRTRPFLRTTEFLWQEGHTAHAGGEDARAFSLKVLALYSTFLSDVLAVPHVTGVKSPSERFAGADDTYTCEAMMGNGWALQAATSHYLGEHFSKAFGVTYMDARGERVMPHATSWGASTRLIGGLIMAHGDDTGIVLPPAVAPTQVVVLAIPPNKKGDSKVTEAEVVHAARRVGAALSAAGLRVAVDDDRGGGGEGKGRLGARFYKWDRAGTPLRVEVGAKEVSSGCAVMRSRVPVPGWDAALPLTGAGGDAGVSALVASRLAQVQEQLTSAGVARMQGNVYACRAYKELEEHAVEAERAQGLEEEGEGEGEGGRPPPSTGGAQQRAPPAAVYHPPSRMFLAPWRDDASAEGEVKAATRFTLRCFPSGGPELAGVDPRDLQATAKGQMCFFSGKPATHMALFARAY